MSILKVEAHERYTLNGILSYIVDQEQHNNSVLYADAIYAARQNVLTDMLVTKQLFNKITGVEFKQLTLSLNSYESDRQTQFINLSLQAAYQLANYTKCQIAFAVHANTDNLHTHFIVNSVSFVDGHKMQLNWKDLDALKGSINGLLISYGFSTILKNTPFK